MTNAKNQNMGTVKETEEDTVRLLENTHDSVKLTLDTGHMLFAQGESLKILNDFSERLIHMHCKDIRKNVLEKSLKEEIKLEKERTKDIKLFLRKEQAILRIEQSERQKQFLKQLQLKKQIEKFRIREVKELEKLEKISLKEKREDYAGLQERIEKLKEKYRIIRDKKIRDS